MKASDIPTKFNIPFASSAMAPYTRIIPQASQIGIQAGAASLTDGFVPVNFLPVAAGGTPPFGADFNGLLNQMTLWTRWQNAGGVIPFDSDFSTAIGGYPKGTVLAALVFGNYWISTVDDNATNPDSGGANWFGYSPVNRFGTDIGIVNALVVTLSPAPVNLSSMIGVPFVVKIAVTNTAVAPVINLNGFGNKTVTNPDDTSLFPGQLILNSLALFVYDGTKVRLLAGSASVPFPTRTTLASGSGNFSTPTGTKRLVCRYIAGGGGGGGSGSGAGTSATSGTLSSFNGVVANPGLLGANNSGNPGGLGGAGGTGGTGSASLRIPGASGGDGPGATSASLPTSGSGASSFFGGGGKSVSPASTGQTAVVPGSGGSGGGTGGSSTGCGGGGGSGEYVELQINNPGALIPYVVGAAGVGGIGTLTTGGAGAPGEIIIDVYYN